MYIRTNERMNTDSRTDEQTNGWLVGVVCSFCSIQPTELIYTARRCVYKKNFYSLLSNILRCLFASTKNTKDKGNSDGSSNILLLLAKKSRNDKCWNEMQTAQNASCIHFMVENSQRWTSSSTNVRTHAIKQDKFLCFNERKNNSAMMRS